MNHNKNIKVYQTLIKFSLLVLTFFLLSFNLTCKDPEDFKPVDSLLPPPSPPEVLLPHPDTIFNGDIYPVLFDWTDIEGAERYEIETDTTPFFSTALSYSAPSPPLTIPCIRYHFPETKYYYRIRAVSTLWIYYTAWTETRFFYLRFDM